MSRHALVVGVANYHKDRTLSRLPAAHADINVVSRVLKERGDFDVKAIVDPDHQELIRALEDLFDNRSPGDTALVYFSGHGLLDKSLERLYLATSDTEEGRLDSSSVDTEVLRRFTAKTSAHCKLVFLDCCYAGMAGDGLRARSGRKVPISAQLNKHGTVILTSSDRISRSFEDPKAAHRPALFTEAVVEGLNGGAADTDGDGWISVQDLADYVQRSEKLRHQTPQMFANGVTGSIQLTRTTANTSKPTHSPTVVTVNGVPEPLHPVSDPLDSRTWERLLNYYLACLAAEAGHAGWLKPGDPSGHVAWPGGTEPVFSGSGTAVELPEQVDEYITERVQTAGSFQYGYPVVVFAEGEQKRFAPLVVTELVPDGESKAKAVAAELNTQVLREAGLEQTEIIELSEQFGQNFRYANPQQFAEQLKLLTIGIGLKTPQEPDPLNLSTRLFDSPLVSGIQNLAVVHHVPERGKATDKLVQDLREMITKIPEFTATALSALAQRQPDPITHYQTLVSPGPLNESQEAVIDSAMTRRLTVATGPPGTGKTALVTALTATAVANGQTILIGSTNNKAVNGVLDKANTITPGLLMRTGNRQIVAREPDVLNRLIMDAKPTGNASLSAGRVRNSHAQLTTHRCELDLRRQTENDLLATVQELQRLREEFNPSAAVAELLNAPDPVLERALARSQRATKRWPLGVIARYWLRKWLEITAVDKRQDLVRLLELEHQRRGIKSNIDCLPPEQEVWKQARQAVAERIAHSSQLIASIMNHNISNGRAAIQERLEVLNQQPPKTWRGFQRLLRHLPGWAVTGHSSRVIQPKPALFDLVVIDEAAQCPTPMVLALLMRAKRALIIGDPHQIPPVAELSQSYDDLLRRKHKLGEDWLKERRLNYVGGSIYHACALAAGEVALLDEHYRCDPAIVATPNRVVYQKQLSVLTDTTRLAIPAAPPDTPAVEVIDLPGTVTHPGKKSCFNSVEADRVVELAAGLRVKYPDASIGVVSPFRAHVNLVEGKLTELKLEPEVVVGTAHTFQGDECDIIILSPVGSDGIREMSAQWMVKQTNLWNVAITRAKSRLFVVCDRGWWGQHPSLLTQLLEETENHDVDDASSELVDRLQGELDAAGVEIIARDQPIAGQHCHLQIAGARRPRALFVDLGEPDEGKAYRQLLAKLDLIAGAGVEPIRIPAWRCLSEPDAVARELAQS
ncbi:caspase, EACC1-associated type [Stackebrandtia nassauensis]|uniref:Peptidase C14 caspase catalytic subunit p20 n=1 Tax=Stackebrandtia nassauensis (strain DSM 44728 / CIP 108903 / NRRL B-16338 / NBRC 102104 / LLR-40K-21) TaxID=446470 RepID=D3Q9D3_STANL|nr:AAA domain-containing protein [Stackebrandtia nassauensis]ADD42615.1 peptidase C14 caspase catalytic subunit p20 [Stackebrandtia nassauensis DSM 44728]